LVKEGLVANLWFATYGVENAGDSEDTVDVRESVKLVILGQRVFFWAIFGCYVIIF
jgi:hypothetical protein